MIDIRYIKYFISGYLNTYYSDRCFAYDSAKESFAQHRIQSVLRYFGLKESKSDLSWLAPILSILEVILGSFLVFGQAIVVIMKCSIQKRKIYEGRIFFASLIFASFRIKGMLDSVRPLEVSTLKLPFTKNDYHENEVNILSVVTVADVLRSLAASWLTIWTQYHKYRKRDPLFRSYSSFEYYLVCCFVERTERKNSFLYYNTYDRWAFLMCNTKGATFVQHGKLMDTLSFIKVGTPETAYYLSKKQGTILEKILFKKTPRNVKFRKPMEFTLNEVLQHNGKKNVLLVCWNNNVDLEWKICEILKGRCNMYIKPHPGDKDNPTYPQMAEKYNCVIIPKTGYPHVDVVISYDSTLADEYEDVDVKVIRYDLLNNLEELKSLI